MCSPGVRNALYSALALGEHLAVLPGMLLSALDVGLLVVYVLMSAGVGLYSAREASTSAASREGYFLAGRTANRWTTGISLLSGLSSGISFLGIPGFAFGHGVMQLWQVLPFVPVTATVISSRGAEQGERRGRERGARVERGAR